MAVGDGVTDINVGDRVACAGAGYAVHAEIACVPRMLVAKIPRRERSQRFVGRGCLRYVGRDLPAWHSYRRSRTRRYGRSDWSGIARTDHRATAEGCRMPRIWHGSFAAARRSGASRSGAEAVCTDAREFRDLCFQQTGGVGVDAVLITAETPSSEPVNLAAELARDRAIVVAVGTVGMELQRKLYYEKELDFRISRSYGPGRYDSAYEQKGRDYPIGHVRWTETRNMAAFLQLIADGKLNLPSLITHRFPMERATRAYDLITGMTREFFLGVLIKYPETESETDARFRRRRLR